MNQWILCGDILITKIVLCAFCISTSYPTYAKQMYKHVVIRQKDKQRATKHTHKTKDRVTRTQLKNRG